MNDKMDNQFTIWIDADGCPVVNSTINIAKTKFYTSYSS